MHSNLKKLPQIKGKHGWPWIEETDPERYKGTRTWPKISIITPSYNQGAYIEQTIRSILLQNYPNLEYIIIDGGSTDQTLEIIKKYELNLSYWVSEKDSGQSNAINKGLLKCTGEYFNWINSDDYLEKDALLNLAMRMDKNTDLIAGFCTSFIEESNKIELSYSLSITESSEKAIVEHSMCQPAMFYRTRILKDYGGVDESLHYVMDLALFTQYVTEFGTQKIKLISDSIAYFRKHSLSKTESLQDGFEHEERLIYSYLLTLSNVSEEKIALISNEAYLPKKMWRLNLNGQILQKLIFKKFLLNKAIQAYAQSNYPFMKEYTNRYLKTRMVEWNMTTLKLMIFSNIISTSVIQSIRKFYSVLIK